MRAIAVLVLAAACAADEPAPSGPWIASHVESFEFPVAYATELDVLIVVDDTAGMTAYSEQIAKLATGLAWTITDEGLALPDARIAVTTTAATGALRASSVTSDPYVATALDARFERTQNFSGTLEAAIGELLAAGTSGTQPVAPLAAAKAALDDNPAFLRPSAYLAIMTIATSDDASAGAALDFVSDLKARKTDPAKVMVTAAYPASSPRLDAFHAAFPNRSETIDIAEADWSPAVLLFLQQVRRTLGAPCVIAPADVDWDTDGVQVDCAAEALYADGSTEVLPWCTAGGPSRCFEIVADPTTCSDVDYSSRLYIRGYPGWHVPSIRGQCVVK